MTVDDTCAHFDDAETKQQLIEIGSRTILEEEKTFPKTLYLTQFTIKYLKMLNAKNVSP